MSNKILGLISIAAKAGKIKSGRLAAEEAIKSKKVFLIILAKDASDSTKKQFINMSEYYQVERISYGTKEILGNAVGKAERSALCVTDEGLAKAIREQL